MTQFDIPKIKRDMSMWREGFAPMPQEYIDLHEQAARADMRRFVAAQGVIPISTDVVRDGWGDGMKVLRLTAQAEGGEVVYQWSDSNGGSWFLDTGHGKSLVEVVPNRPGHL